MPLTKQQEKELDAIVFEKMLLEKEARREERPSSIVDNSKSFLSDKSWSSFIKPFIIPGYYIITPITESNVLYSLSSINSPALNIRLLNNKIESCMEGILSLFSIETIDKKYIDIIEIEHVNRDFFNPTYYSFLEIADSLASDEHFYALTNIATTLCNIKNSEEFAQFVQSCPSELKVHWHKSEVEGENSHCPFQSIQFSGYTIAPLHDTKEIKNEFNNSEWWANVLDMFLPLCESGDGMVLAILYPEDHVAASFTIVRAPSGYWRPCFTLHNLRSALVYPINLIYYRLARRFKNDKTTV